MVCIIFCLCPYMSTIEENHYHFECKSQINRSRSLLGKWPVDVSISSGETSVCVLNGKCTLNTFSNSSSCPQNDFGYYKKLLKSHLSMAMLNISSLAQLHIFTKYIQWKVYLTISSIYLTLRRPSVLKIGLVIILHFSKIDFQFLRKA